MADISYVCPSCGGSRMVSEFADPQKIRCAACEVLMHGAADTPAPAEPTADTTPPPPPPTHSNETTSKSTSGQAPEPPPASPAANRPKPQRLKLARERNAPKQTDTPAKSEPVLPPPPSAPLDLHPKTKRKKPLISNTFLVFLTFLLVGSASGFVRYGGLVPPDILDLIRTYSWAGILFLHLLITVRALSTDIMQGILCLLIPGWSLFYLAISDQFFLKAIVFGLLIGLMEDGGMQIFAFTSDVLSSIQEFISSGGGDLRGDGRTAP